MITESFTAFGANYIPIHQMINLLKVSQSICLEKSHWNTLGIIPFGKFFIDHVDEAILKFFEGFTGFLDSIGIVEDFNMSVTLKVYSDEYKFHFIVFVLISHEGWIVYVVFDGAVEN